jgi:colicin import membrane protein
MADPDASVEEELGQAARLAIAVAGQAADRLARARQELAVQTQRRSEQEYRQLDARFRAEAAVAGARLSAVERPDWWDRADVPQIAAMHDLAQQWQQHDPHAAIAAETIARQVRDRYGINVSAPGADPQQVRAALAHLELDRAGQDTTRETTAGEVAQAIQAIRVADLRDPVTSGTTDNLPETETTDRDPDPVLLNRAAELEVEAAEFETLAGQGGTDLSTPEELRAMAADSRAQAQQYRDQAAGPQSEAIEHADSTAAPATTTGTAAAAVAAPSYDSDERRQATVGRMREQGVPEDVIAVAMRADVAQGRPAAEAVSSTRRQGVLATRQAAVRTRSAQRPDRSR